MLSLLNGWWDWDGARRGRRKFFVYLFLWKYWYLKKTQIPSSPLETCKHQDNWIAWLSVMGKVVKTFNHDIYLNPDFSMWYWSQGVSRKCYLFNCRLWMWGGLISMLHFLISCAPSVRLWSPGWTMILNTWWWSIAE